MDILQKLKNNQRRIGLTGGIASGKTTITNYIRKHKNIPILDADHFSRELIKPNTYGYKKILDYFGNKIIDNKNNSERAINRKLLRKIIFKYYFLPPTITGGLPPSEPGRPGTTCVLPSHLSRNNLKRT